VLNGEVQPSNNEAINNLPQTKVLKFTKSVQYFANSKTSRQVLEAGLDRFIPLIKKHKEMISQMFDIKISVIMSEWQTLKHKLALANIIFRKTFGLTLKGRHVRTGNPNVFEIKLMDCFTYVDGVMTLKLPSGKLIKSNLNQPKPLAPEVPLVFEGPPASKTLLVPEVPPEGLPDIKPIDPMYNIPCLMDNIVHPDDSPLLIWHP